MARGTGRKRPAPEPWRCPLCGGRNGGKTIEHIVTLWMHDFWGAGTFTGFPGDVRQRQHVKVFICGHCNDYFNRELEEHCRPLLKRMMRGESVLLTPWQQDRLTRYFAKFFLLMSVWPHFPLGNDPYITTEDLRRFAHDLTLPRGTRLWLGAVDDANPVREQAVMRAVPEAFTDPPNGERRWLMPLGSSCHLLQLQHVFAVLFWLRPRSQPGLVAENDATLLLARTARVGLLSRVFPTVLNDLAWPPRESFDKTTYHVWADRFGYVPPGMPPTIRWAAPRP